jgi:isopenicillin-N epimerase
MSNNVGPTNLAGHWQLASGLTFLNHGSFGATPTIVLQQQRQFQDALEADPILFLAPERDLEPKLDHVRAILANFLGASSDRLAFVRNATDGVNAVLRSVHWNAGDQILVTNHGYNACVNAARFVADRYDLQVVEATVPFPIASPEQVLEAIDQAMTPRTRILLVDHVTSPTGLIFPIERIVELARLKNIRVLVDGAHAPGMLPLSLDRLAADYYTANHHKWLCAPKVSGFLYVQPQWQHEVRPTVISHAANRPRPNRSRFLAEFDWTGTFDPTPLLAVPKALEFLSSLYPGGMAELLRCNREKTLAGRQLLLDALQLECPAPNSMIGSLATIPLLSSRFNGSRLLNLKSALYNRFRIELPVFPHISSGDKGDWMLRIAMQAYNDLSQIDKLVDALKQLLGVA